MENYILKFWDENECFKKLKEKGVNLEIRKVPTESAEDINKLFS